MTADERDLTPEEEAEFSRLLAEAGGPVPTPPEVVARLDDVLAGLVAERSAGAGARTAPVSLEAERRRRRWPQALLAAAAVVAGGYGLGAALTGTTMSGDADSAISADESAAGGSSSSGSDAGGDAGGDGQAMESEREAPEADLADPPANSTALRGAPPRLRPDHLAEDVVRVLDGSRQEPSAAASPAPSRALVGAAAGCSPAGLGPDETWYLVRYDGRRAALVETAPEGDTVRASVIGCDGERLASVTVPAG
jgi:hypothetical protein